MHFLELVNRSYTGEVVSKDDWDMEHVVMPMMDIVEEFDLNRENGELLLHDREQARAYFEAGVEFLVRSGVYNQSTGRVIRFTREEILEAARGMPQAVTVGRGADAFTFEPRHPDSARLPGVVAGNPGCPMTEEQFRRTVMSWAKEPVVDMVTCGSIVEVDGFKVVRASPSEVIALRRELKYLNEICAKVGRPGIGRLAAESSVSEIGDLAAMAPGGFQPGDAHLIALNNELIITNDNLIRVANAIDTPVFNASLACVMVGGLAGGAPGAAVCMIASLLADSLVGRADYHLCHPIHIKYIATSTPECMWLSSAVCQAFDACAPAVVICDIYPKSGAGTVELLREVAANALAITVSGGHLEGVGSCDGLKPNCSGLEARLMGEVGKAAAAQGMTRAQAEPIIARLLDEYQHIFEKRNEGLPFEEVYGEDGEPRGFWLGMYEEVKNELIGLGLKL
ncbi:MAG: monomethylamine:corrinoid methyltransferase [Clostridia bacterium]|nr:monomethylamine:corrinoid methyltransferase [Clostridia bacterium]